MQQRELTYVSDGASTPAELTDYVLSRELILRGITFDEVEREDWATHWNRLVILDARDQQQSAFEMLQHIVAANAGLPIIVFARVNRRPLGQVAAARCDGAEAILFEPFAGIPAVFSVLDAAIARLDRWLEMLQFDATEVAFDEATRADSVNQLTTMACGAE